jgi:FtsH-binding integral membrane protein
MLFLVTYYDQGIVLQALLITFGVFLALTIFTLQSKWDFSGMAPM